MIARASVNRIAQDDSSRGFPWGSGKPARPQRLLVSVVIASIAALAVLSEYMGAPGHHSDFGMSWFGARTLLAGRDPWALVGPGLEFDWRWPLLYPTHALLLALPFSWMSEAAASATFIWISTFLLVWGATRSSWHRIPAFASLPFLIASSAGQWSALLASSWFLPATAVAWAAKPTLGAALALGTLSRRHLLPSVAGAVTLGTIGFLMQPAWFSGWISVLGDTSHMRPPIFNWGGFAIAASLLRWRRPEARLLFALACVPQSPAVYDLLLLLVIMPDTYHEALALSLGTTLGLLLAQLIPEVSQEVFLDARGMISVVACYLPATVLVLRRKNKAIPR